MNKTVLNVIASVASSVIGGGTAYLLTKKKADRFLQTKLEETARNTAIQMVREEIQNQPNGDILRRVQEVVDNANVDGVIQSVVNRYTDKNADRLILNSIGQQVRSRVDGVCEKTIADRCKEEIGNYNFEKQFADQIERKVERFIRDNCEEMVREETKKTVAKKVNDISNALQSAQSIASMFKS